MKAQQIDPKKWDRARLKKLLKDFRKKNILVIGDVGVDRYTIGEVDRISPEAPVPIVWVREQNLKLGLAGNVADNVKTLGGEPRLIGVIGRDRHGQDLKKILSEASVSSQALLVDPVRPTVLKERVVSNRQQLLRIDYEVATPISKTMRGKILQRFLIELKRVDAVILQDYAKGMMSEELCQKVIHECKRAGVPVAIDPNSKTPVSHYRGGPTMLTPNLREAEVLAGIKIDSPASLLKAGEALLQKTQAKHVIITRGKDGMTLFSADTGRVTTIPTYAREVYDVSGAGDTVISVLALGMATEASLEDAAILANLAAGVEVGKRGTATVTPAEVLEAMAGF